MKHSKGYGIIMIVIAIIFFLVAANGFIHLAYGKPPIMKPANHTGANKMGFYFAEYVRFYLLPFFWAFVGWLLYKCGTEKVKSTVVEEKESQKISE
jgi:hypothetical protein